MEFSIRAAVYSDAAEIARLNRISLGYDYSEEATAKNLHRILALDSNRIFVAVVENAVVGYVHACNYDSLYFVPMKNIMGIAVDPAYRRRGIGRALMTAVENWAKETGVNGIRLVSGIGREGAHEFYRRLGFSGEKKQINFKKYVEEEMI